MDIFRNFRRKLSEHTAEIIAAGSVAAIVAIGTPCIASYLTPPAYAADSAQTLTEDKYVTGNFIVNGDLDLNGHSLTVTGDLIHKSGNITANGDISIGGNYITENSDDSSNFKTLRFASSDSQTRRSLYIGGDLRAYSLHIATDNQDYSGYDQISVGGSFYGSEASYDSSNYDNSDAKDDEVVLVDNYNTPYIIFQFNGDRIHSISGNTGNVVVDSCQGRLKIGSGNIAIGAGCDITLAPGSKFHGGTIFKGKTISAESGIELDGSLRMLSDSSLYVKGNLTAKNDATIFSEGYSENGNNGNININVTGNIIFIDGKFEEMYRSSCTFNLTAGGDISFSTDSLSSAVNQMSVGGGLYVTNSSGSSELIIPKLYFTGNSEHELTMYNNGSSGNDGSGSSGEYSSRYLRINEFYPSGTVNFTRGTTVNIDRCAKLTISGSEFNGYINANSLTTTGDLTLYGTVYIVDGTFTVNGNLTQSDSNSTIHLSGKSTLKTTGDYNFDSGSIFADSESQIAVGGSFNVSSSAKFGSSSSGNYNDSYSSNYPIKIGGDLTVIGRSMSGNESSSDHESTPSYNFPSLYFTGAEEHNISYPAGTAFNGADVRITELKSDGPVNIAKGITTNIERCTKLTLSGSEFNGAITAESLTTTGDLTLNGEVYITDGTFTVNGNLTQSDSNSAIHLSGKSTLKTTGDYNFTSGSIYANYDSQVIIGGSFNLSPNAKFGSGRSASYDDSYPSESSNSFYSNYPIKIGGDLTVIGRSMSGNESSSDHESTPSYNFPSLYFTGAEEHNISYPAGTAFNGADVRITELKSDGPVNIAKGITTNIERCTKLTLSGSEFNGAIYAESLTTTDDLTLNGEVYITDGTFTVNGNLTQSGEDSAISVDGENAKVIVNGDLNSANISGRGALYLNGEYGQTISGKIDLTTLVLSQKPDMYRIADDAVLNVEKYKFRKIDPASDVTFKLGITMYQGGEWSEITNNTVDISELGSKIPEARYAKAGPFDFSEKMTTTTNYTSESGAGTYYADVTLDSADITVRVPFIVTDRESGHTDPSTCEHVYSITTTLPTCTTNGSVVKTCIKCGDEVTSTTPASGHTWSEWVQFNSTTMTHTCTVCSNMEVKNTEETPGHTHKFTEEVTPATCTTAGYTTYTCEECGERYIDNIINPSHKYDNEKVINGIVTRSCIICGNTIVVDSNSKHVHVFKTYKYIVDGVEFEKNVCDCGATVYNRVIFK